MTQHFTRNTVSAAFYCPKCKRTTQHRIDGVRKGPCLECIKRLEEEHAKCSHDRLDEEGFCRRCGADMRSGVDMQQDLFGK